MEEKKTERRIQKSGEMGNLKKGSVDKIQGKRKINKTLCPYIFSRSHTSLSETIGHSMDVTGQI